MSHLHARASDQLAVVFTVTSGVTKPSQELDLQACADPNRARYHDGNVFGGGGDQNSLWPAHARFCSSTGKESNCRSFLNRVVSPRRKKKRLCVTTILTSSTCPRFFHWATGVCVCVRALFINPLSSVA